MGVQRRRKAARWIPCSAPGRSLGDLYEGRAAYSGRVTVPVLWDKAGKHYRLQRIGRDLPHVQLSLRRADGLDAGFLSRTPARRDRCAQCQDLRCRNNGVYKAGFASTQDAYAQAVTAVFAMLDELEEKLSGNGTGRQRLTEATGGSSPRSSASTRSMSATSSATSAAADYPNLSAYLKDLYQVPGVAETVNFHHIKTHYYASTASSIRPASCRSVPSSTSTHRMGGKGSAEPYQ